MRWLVLGVAGLLGGCGPDLRRPGWKPPEPEREKSAIEKFQDATHVLLSQLRFHFDYINYSPLSGVKSEISRVVAKYPPHMIGTSSIEITSLEIDKLTDNKFKSFLTDAGFAPHDLECARDYSNLCPPRWADLGDGDTCEGPPAQFQDEECRQVKFGGLNPVEKSAAAFKCGESKFPCRNECLYRDYDEICPERWTRVPGTYKCVAPADYVKPCSRVYDFTDHGSNLKQKFESMCKVNWKCRQRTIGNINSHRP